MRSHARLAPGITLGALFLLALTLTSSFAFNSSTPKPSSLLQFTSQHHILGFDAGHWYVSNGTYALRVGFVHANQVMPTTASTTSVSDNGAPPLTRVSYPNLWDGVTLTYRATPDGIVESVYEIAPQGGVEKIRLAYNAPLHLNTNGSLTAAFTTGEMTESAPIAWQERNGERQDVPVEFVLDSATSEVAVAVGAHDPTATLYIDPTLEWNTFLGGGGYDESSSIAVDSTGNVYVAGYSDAAWGTPVRAYTSSFDGFVAKLDASGALVWNTFLGGSGFDSILGIAVDGSANPLVAGTSDATWGGGECSGCPLRAYTASGDGFVAKLDASGALVWNTFLGGSENDAGWWLAVDGSGNFLVAGASNAAWGTPVRAYTASYDTFAAKLDPTGALVWNSFLGGSGSDTVGGIAVDGSGNVYVTGNSNDTWGAPVRAYDTNGDAFAAKMDGSGALVWNTFLGGTGFDEGKRIAADASGNSYITGQSNATWGGGECTGCPLRAYTADYDIFVTKLDTDGALVWNTFLGGSGHDGGYGIAVGGSGNVYVTGRSDATWGTGECVGCPFRAYTAEEDLFAARLGSAGGLVWNTFLGGSGDDSGYSIAVDDSGNVYVGGYSTATWGAGDCTGCPIRAYTADYDALAAKISDATTAVNVSGVVGVVKPNGKLVLKWRTTTEALIAGFNVYRKQKNGQWTMQNAQLIPAKRSGDAAGARYRFQDKSVRSGKKYRYKIEVNYLDGHKEMTKVVKVKTPQEASQPPR